MNGELFFYCLTRTCAPFFSLYLQQNKINHHSFSSSGASGHIVVRRNIDLAQKWTEGTAALSLHRKKILTTQLENNSKKRRAERQNEYRSIIFHRLHYFDVDIQLMSGDLPYRRVRSATNEMVTTVRVPRRKPSIDTDKSWNLFIAKHSVNFQVNHWDVYSRHRHGLLLYYSLSYTCRKNTVSHYMVIRTNDQRGGSTVHFVQVLFVFLCERPSLSFVQATFPIEENVFLPLSKRRCRTPNQQNSAFCQLPFENIGAPFSSRGQSCRHMVMPRIKVRATEYCSESWSRWRWLGRRNRRR